MMLDVLLKKVVREKDSWVFSHSRFKQFFVASRTYQEVDVVPGIYLLYGRGTMCTWKISMDLCMCICICVLEQRLAWNTRWLLTQLTGH